MADPQALHAAVQTAQEAVTRQGDTVRALKAQLKEGKVERVRRTWHQLPVDAVTDLLTYAYIWRVSQHCCGWGCVCV
jgi:hypothetical protein